MDRRLAKLRFPVVEATCPPSGCTSVQKRSVITVPVSGMTGGARRRRRTPLLRAGLVVLLCLLLAVLALASLLAESSGGRTLPLWDRDYDYLRSDYMADYSYYDKDYQQDEGVLQGAGRAAAENGTEGELRR